MAGAMRKAVLMILLAATSGSAAADWVWVGKNKFGIVYADPATIRRAGNLVRMWDMSDYKATQTVGGKPYLSMRTQYEYDCDKDRSRLLELFAHPENMAGGEAVYSEVNPRNWRPNPPDSGIARLWKFACEK